MSRNRRPELWVVGQKDNVVNQYDLITGKLAKSFATGNKPVDIGAYDNRLFILSKCIEMMPQDIGFRLRLFFFPWYPKYTTAICGTRILLGYMLLVIIRVSYS